MKVLLLPDKHNWAYESIAVNLRKYNTDKDIDLSIIPIKGNEKKIKKIYKKFDRILVMGFQNYERIEFLPKKETLIGIHSFHSWDGKKTTPENMNDRVPPRKLVDFLNQFARVNAVSQQLTNVFNKAGVDVVYTPNGVDTEEFIPRPSNNKKLTVGYSGSSAHDWRKGISEIIQSAAKKAKVQTHLAMLSSGQYVPLDSMPMFYQKLDIYLCASLSEGFSLSVLEAASCGLPIISTRVGGCIDLIEDGKNGFLADRTLDAFVEKIEMLKDNDLRDKISAQITQDIRDKWCWSIRAKAWIEFLKGNL